MKKNRNTIISTLFIIIIFIFSIFLIVLYYNQSKQNDNQILENENIIEEEQTNNDYIEVDNSNQIDKINSNNDTTSSESEETNNKNSDTVNDTIITTLTSNGFTITNNNGVYSIDGIVIANKTYSLPKSYGNGLTSELTTAFNNMKNDALKDRITLSIISGFRSYDTQVSTYNYWVSKYGKIEADTISARPGHSEHQTGLAIDINSLKKAFKNTAEGKWLNDNAYKYGFILRYPENKENITGYDFEPWHYRYVGTDLSYKLYNDGNWITIEEYFGITSSYE